MVRERQELSRLMALKTKMPSFDNPLQGHAKGVTKLHITYKPTTVSTVTALSTAPRSLSTALHSIDGPLSPDTPVVIVLDVAAFTRLVRRCHRIQAPVITNATMRGGQDLKHRPMQLAKHAHNTSRHVGPLVPGKVEVRYRRASCSWFLPGADAVFVALQLPQGASLHTVALSAAGISPDFVAKFRHDLNHVRSVRALQRRGPEQGGGVWGSGAAGHRRCCRFLPCVRRRCSFDSPAQSCRWCAWRLTTTMAAPLVWTTLLPFLCPLCNTDGRCPTEKTLTQPVLCT